MKRNLIVSFSLVALSVTLIFLMNTDKKEVSINGQTFKVEVVSADKDRRRGLGGRSQICDDCGMLFLFQEPGKYSFWMKGMKFDLDIIWISEGKIVHMAKNFSKDSKELIMPEVEADKVLEIRAGLSDEHGFQIGDSVQF